MFRNIFDVIPLQILVIIRCRTAIADKPAGLNTQMTPFK